MECKSYGIERHTNGRIVLLCNMKSFVCVSVFLFFVAVSIPISGQLYIKYGID